MREATRRASTVLLAFIAAVTLFVAYSIGNIAQATHQPADKEQATGSTLQRMSPGDRVELLSETLRVSSPSDLILQFTAECSIITALKTGDDSPGGPDEQTDAASAEGTVRVWVEIDGTPVPVATDDTRGAGDQGRVVFCNRAHQRRVTESELNDPEDDGLDEIRDYLRTRQANGFNWFALNTGREGYDADGDNVLSVVVYAQFITQNDPNQAENCTLESIPEPADACSEAFVGNRTLIIEPVHAQNDEQVGPGPVEASPSHGAKKP